MRRLLRSIAAGGAMLSILLMAALAGVDPRPVLAAPILTSASFATPPIAVGGSHICALPGDGTVLCWGGNTFGQVGSGEVFDPTAPAGDTVVLQTVIADSASAGGRQCVDVAQSGFIVRCQGSASLTDVTAIAAGFSHNCALMADTTVQCWGSNAPVDGGIFSASLSGGELGDGTTVARPFPAPVIAGPGQSAPLVGVRALSAATGYTCALMEDGTAKCWGNAPQAVSTTPMTVTADGSTPLTGISVISAGDANACAALTDGSVVCWGTGLLGDQRSDTERDGTMPVRVTVAGAASTGLEGIQALALGHNVFNGPNGFAMGHSCALTAAGEVRCWGWNDVSQLGNGFNAVTGGFESERDYAVPVIAAPGSSDLLVGVVSIAAGGYATCALIDDGSVMCWGLSFGGDSFEGAGAPVPLEIAATSTVRGNGGVALAGFGRGSVETAGAPIGNVVALAGGGEAGICAVRADGSVWCLDFVGGMVARPGVFVAAPAPIPAPTPATTPAPPPTSAPGGPTSAPGGPEAVIGEWDGGRLTVTYADGVYSMTSLVILTTAEGACQLPAGTVVGTFSGTDGLYRGQQLVVLSVDCSTEWRPVTLTLDGDRLRYELSGVQNVLLRSGAAPMLGEPKTFRDSIPTPGRINLDPAVVVQSLIFTGGLILLLPFPSGLFNNTLEANYAEIMGGVRRARRRVRTVVLGPWLWLRRKLGLAGAASSTADAGSGQAAGVEPAASDAAGEPTRDFWWTSAGIGLFILLTVLLASLLDPSFGLNLPSVATFVGMLIGLLVLLAAFDIPVARFYRRHDIGFWKHALPATVAVSIACVLISRLTDFQPGYLYGLIIATFTARKLDMPTEGKLMAVAVTSSVAAAVVAWFGLGVVGPLAAASPNPGPVLITAQTALSMIVVAGVELASFGMLPVSFLVGKSIYSWSKTAWAGISGFGWLAFFIVILNPQNGFITASHTPIYTVVALLGFFGIGSVLFWFYFQRRRTPQHVTRS